VQVTWLVRLGLGVMVSSLAVTTGVRAADAHSDLVGCDGCHVPHNAKQLPGVPLWNGSETAITFTMYSSKTLQATMDGQPSGASRLCLSCHDVHTSGVGESQLRGYNYGYEAIQNPDGSSSQMHHGPDLCRMCHLKQDICASQIGGKEIVGSGLFGKSGRKGHSSGFPDSPERVFWKPG
jgi:hypothetical protein